MKKRYAILFASFLGCSSAFAANPPLPALLSGLNLSGLLGSNPVPAGLPALSGLTSNLGSLNGLLGGLSGLAPLIAPIGKVGGSTGLLGLNGVLGLNQLPGPGNTGVLSILSSSSKTGALLLGVGEVLENSNGTGLLTGVLKTGNGGLLGFALPVVNGVLQ